jgi:RNA polymerase sigma-70 factor (sigma-E family)
LIRVSGERETTVPVARHEGVVAGPDAPSFTAVYEEWFESMVRVAYLLVGDLATAEDVVQDAFAQLHRRWGAVEQPAGYVRASVVNGCRQHHRRSARERARYSQMLAPDAAPETPDVLAAVARLPFRQRAALVMRFYEDRTDDEIAAALDCRPATVRSLVHRGLRTLQKRGVGS